MGMMFSNVSISEAPEAVQKALETAFPEGMFDMSALAGEENEVRATDTVSKEYGG